MKEMSDKEYIELLENSIPATEIIGLNPDGDYPDEQASPNTAPEGNNPENKPEGKNEFNLKMEKGETNTPKAAGKAEDYNGDGGIKSELQNPVATWDGSGALPSTFDDPLLSKLIDKFTKDISDRFGVNESQDVSPLSLLEEEDEDADHEDEEADKEEDHEEPDGDEDEEGNEPSEVKESAILMRLIEEMDEITDEIENEDEDEDSDDEEDGEDEEDEDEEDEEDEDEEDEEIDEDDEE